ncbi:glycoside hydrolase domain-containing protein [Planctomycetota bacterium]
MRKVFLTVSLVAVFAVLIHIHADAQENAEPPAKAVILANGSYWRVFLNWKTPVVISEEGTIKPLKVRFSGNKVKELNAWQSALPAADWMKSGYNDTGWSRAQLPFGADPWLQSDQRTPGNPAEINVIYARGKFRAENPSSVKHMKLSVVYYGGCTVYVNGKELIRKHIPSGNLKPETLAETYPAEAYFSSEGNRLSEADYKKNPGPYNKRVRMLKEIQIPSSMLVKGINIVGIEIRRAALREKWLTARAVKANWRGSFGAWPHARLLKTEITADPGSGLEPNISRPEGLQVWPCFPLQTLYTWDYGEPADPSASLHIDAARNGVFSGRITVSSDTDISNLKVTVGKLIHEDSQAGIPAEAVSVRYALRADPKTSWIHARNKAGQYRFDALTHHAPQIVKVESRFPSYKKGTSGWHKNILSRFPMPPTAPWFLSSMIPSNIAPPETVPVVPGAVQPVWITVRAPKKAKPGTYKTKVTVSAEGHKPVTMELALSVHGYSLPDAGNFATMNNLYQSHDSIARYYKVPLWSDKHFELMGKSLKLGKEVGNRFCPIYMVANAYCVGNAQSMVRWIKKKDGSFDYDFSVFDRYLDLFDKTVGNPGVVLLHVWTRGCDKGSRSYKKNLYKVTLLNPETGTTELMNIPEYGTPEGETFWRPVLTQALDRLKKRGWYEVTAIGSDHDSHPSKETVSMFKKIWPECKWMHTAHNNPSSMKSAEGEKVPIPFSEHVWAAGNLYNPDYNKYNINLKGHKYPVPWKRGYKRLEWGFARYGVCFIYCMYDGSDLAIYGAGPEGTLQGNLNGIGRVGLDFWPLEDMKPRGVFDSLAGSSHYGMSASFLALLTPGVEGPVLNERFEMLRQGIQISEAMIYIQKGIHSGTLSDTLKKECLDMLDNRARYYLRTRQGQRNLWFAYSSGYGERTGQLFALAAKVKESHRDTENTE